MEDVAQINIPLLKNIRLVTNNKTYATPTGAQFTKKRGG
jgi:hypothetical protein